MTEPRIWLIRRNCSASPRQLALVFVSLMAVALIFGIAFAAQGLWLVLPFVGLELLAVAAAFVCYGRHAGDFERIELRDAELTVVKAHGSLRSESRFVLPWVQVEMEESHRGARRPLRVMLVSARQRVAVGGLLVDNRRAGLAHEIRAALAAANRGV